MGTHYVPKFYLRGFAKSDRFAVFDKEARRWFHTQPKSVANEVGLWPDELETFVTESIEEPAKDVIDRLRNKGPISEDERHRLARYITFLWKRVPAGRERVRESTPTVADQIKYELDTALDNLVRIDGTATELVEKRRAEIASYIDKIKLERPTSLWHGSLTVESGLDAGRGGAAMKWMILHTSGPRYFASDNPVFFFKSDGVGNVTSELTLPLSSSASLVGIHTTSSLPLHCQASDRHVREVNRRTASNASRYIFTEQVEPWMKDFLLKSSHELTRRMFHLFS